MAWFQVNFYSSCLKREVPVQVLIPLDAGNSTYDYEAAESYKTLYLLHGYGGNQSSYLFDSDMKEISEKYQIAVVMPSGDNDFYLDRPRQELFCGEYVGKELVDFTRKLFPKLSGKRDDTIIGGLSMGAYGSLINGLKYHDTFGHVIVNSTSLCRFFIKSAEEAGRNGLNRFGINKGFYEQVFGPLDSLMKSRRCNPTVIVRELLEEGVTFPDLFISVGYNDELCFELRDFVDFLRENKIKTEYQEYPGSHEWAVFNKGLSSGLDRICKCAEKKPDTFWIDNTPISVSAGNGNRR